MKKTTFIAVLWGMLFAWTIADERPNILLILSDDMGWSDIGCFGGDAETLTLDGLAENGIRFTQFYNAARCMPSRASLLTGLYPHQAGIGHMAENWGVPAYQGYLRDDCVTIAEVLGRAGYHTSQLGKWHVGNEKKGVMPYTRGFDRSWVRIGKVDYFRSDIYELDGKEWICPDPEHFYSTEEMDRQAVRFIDDARDAGKPFFMYAAYDAAHWPLHAKPEDVEKYKGRFMQGWDQLRKERFKRLQQLGLVSKDWKPQPRDPSVPAWDDTDNKELWDLKMAVYCAQIDSMDHSIGRIVDYLKKNGMLDNTLIFFLQDNGACPEGIGLKGPKSKITPGPAESFMSYHMPWANLSNTPFQLYKHFTGEGGIRTPLIAFWPKGIVNPGQISDETGFLIDIMATCVDVAGADYPERFNGHAVQPMEGISLDPVFKTGHRKGHDVICWEHEGNRAVRKGDWKLMSRYEEDSELFRKWGFPKSGRTKEWELYDLKSDPTELEDVSAKYPETVAALIREYEQWAGRVGALPYAEISKKNKQKGSRED